MEQEREREREREIGKSESELEGPDLIVAFRQPTCRPNGGAAAGGPRCCAMGTFASQQTRQL